MDLVVAGGSCEEQLVVRREDARDGCGRSVGELHGGDGACACGRSRGVGGQQGSGGGRVRDRQVGGEGDGRVRCRVDAGHAGGRDAGEQGGVHGGAEGGRNAALGAVPGGQHVGKGARAVSAVVRGGSREGDVVHHGRSAAGGQAHIQQVLAVVGGGGAIADGCGNGGGGCLRIEDGRRDSGVGAIGSAVDAGRSGDERSDRRHRDRDVIRSGRREIVALPAGEGGVDEQAVVRRGDVDRCAVWREGRAVADAGEGAGGGRGAVVVQRDDLPRGVADHDGIAVGRDGQHRSLQAGVDAGDAVAAGRERHQCGA